MKQTISFYDFRDAFRNFDRLDNFSYDGARILFDYLEEIEEGSDQEIELDVIALCCDYSEGTPEEIASYYGMSLTDDYIDEDLADMDDDEKAEALEKMVMDYLQYHTSVCGQTDAGTIVYCSAF
jgi:hypothetical protein